MNDNGKVNALRCVLVDSMAYVITSVLKIDSSTASHWLSQHMHKINITLHERHGALATGNLLKLHISDLLWRTRDQWITLIKNREGWKRRHVMTSKRNSVHHMHHPILEHLFHMPHFPEVSWFNSCHFYNYDKNSEHGLSDTFRRQPYAWWNDAYISIK